MYVVHVSNSFKQRGGRGFVSQVYVVRGNTCVS